MEEYMENTKIPLVWWGVMAVVSVVNVIAFFFLDTTDKTASETLKERPNYRRVLRIFGGIYAFVCAFRAVLPRIDVERICFWDSPLSSVLLGRTVATVAELAFAGQVCLVVASLASDLLQQKAKIQKPVQPLQAYITQGIRFCSALCFFAIILAEICSWTGLLTTIQVWNTMEETLWMLASTLITACCGILYLKMEKRTVPFPTHQEKERHQAAQYSAEMFLKGVLIMAPIYVAYLCAVDIPMYYSRWQASGGQLPASLPSFLSSIKQGFSTPGCLIVARDLITWKLDMIWMGGYFSAGVWLALWMAAYPPRMSLAFTKEKAK